MTLQKYIDFNIREVTEMVLDWLITSGETLTKDLKVEYVIEHCQDEELMAVQEIKLSDQELQQRILDFYDVRQLVEIAEVTNDIIHLEIIEEEGPIKISKELLNESLVYFYQTTYIAEKKMDYLELERALEGYFYQIFNALSEEIKEKVFYKIFTYSEEIPPNFSVILDKKTGNVSFFSLDNPEQGIVKKIAQAFDEALLNNKMKNMF